MKKFLSNIKTKLFTKVEKEHSEAYMRRIAFLNKLNNSLEVSTAQFVKST